MEGLEYKQRLESGDRAMVSNVDLNNMVHLKHRNMNSSLPEKDSSDLFRTSILNHLLDLLGGPSQNIERYLEKPIPTNSSGNVNSRPKNLPLVLKPDVAATIKVVNQTKTEVEDLKETKEDGKNKEILKRIQEKKQKARENEGGEAEGGKKGKEERRAEMDELFSIVVEFKKYPIHESLHNAYQKKENPKNKAMKAFQGRMRTFQELGLDILASKCFGGILSDSFHTFVTEIDLKRLKKGIEYKTENGIFRPVLPLVVRYINLESQYRSLHLDLVAANVYWNELTTNELLSDRWKRHDKYQTLLDKAQQTAKKVPRQAMSQPSGSWAAHKELTEAHGDERPKKRPKGIPKGADYGLADNITGGSINPYDISLETSIAFHEDRRDKIPMVYVDPDDLIETVSYKNYLIFKVKARSLREAVVPEDNAGLSDEDILFVKLVYRSDDAFDYFGQDTTRNSENETADHENAFIDQILPHISGFNNCYIRHRAVNLKVYDREFYTGHFVLSRFNQNIDVPLETIKDKIEEQKEILRSGSVVHEDLQPRNFLYDGEKVYIVDSSLAVHVENNPV